MQKMKFLQEILKFCVLGFERVRMNKADDLALLEPEYVTSAQINSAKKNNS